MKYSYIVVGLLICTLCYFGQNQLKLEYKVQKEGVLKKMKIIDIPGSCLGTKAKYFMKVEELMFKKIYTKQIGGQYCEEHYLGQIIQLRVLEGYDIVLLPSETVEGEFYALLFLFLFGIFMIITGFIGGDWGNVYQKIRKR